MLKIDGTFLVQLGFFLAFMLVLNVFVFRPMRAYLARRQRTIDNLRADAGGAQTTLDELAASYSTRIGEAREEMLGCRASARKDGLEKQRAVIEEAKRQAVLAVDAAEDELKREVAAAREYFASEAKTLAGSIAAKVSGRAI